MLPRVCKRWARILRQPSAAWQRIAIGSCVLERPGRREKHGYTTEDLSAISAWFGR